MTGLAFSNQTVIVVTPGVKTVHGNETADWKNPAAAVPLPGCTVQPVQGAESTDGRDATLVQWQVLAFNLEAASAITEKNHIKFGGLEYEIVAAPLPNIFGLRTDHVQILMNVWKG